MLTYFRGVTFFREGLRYFQGGWLRNFQGGHMLEPPPPPPPPGNLLLFLENRRGTKKRMGDDSLPVNIF